MSLDTHSHPYPADPLRIIHVRGSDRDIGRQHGEAVGKTASDGMVGFLSGFWDRMIHQRQPGQGALARMSQQAATFVIDRAFRGCLAMQIPQFLGERMRGMAEACSIPMNRCMAGIVIPDLAFALQTWLFQLKPGLVANSLASFPFGCTSFVSAGKSFLHGRNLEFPGAGFWDRYPVIQATSPRDGLRYIALTSAGIPLGGISGVNEAQISVALHQHFGNRARLRGIPPFAVGEEILRKARTIGEAIQLASRAPFVTSWAFVITDGKTREAAICECRPGGFGILRMDPADPVIVHSNFFQTPGCRPSESSLRASMTWDNYARKERLELLVRRAGENLSPDEAVKILGDHVDPFWQEEKVAGRTVSHAFNVQSYVLDPENMRLCFAEGNSPIHLREYRQFDLAEIFAGRTGEKETRLPGNRYLDPARAAANEAYVLGSIESMAGHDEAALEWLEKSLQLDSCPDSAYVAGLLSLRLGESYRAERHLESARNSIEQKMRKQGRQEQVPPEYFEVLLFLARARAMTGKREQAEALFSSVAGNRDLKDENLRRIARTAKFFGTREASMIQMPFTPYSPLC